MSKITKIFLTPILLLTFFALGIRASAVSQSEYIVSADSGEYILSSEEGAELLRFNSLNALISCPQIAENSRLIFSSVSSDEEISVIRGGVIFSGNLTLTKGDLVIENDSIFDGLSLSFTADNGVRVKEGSLRVEESEIFSISESTVRLDYSSLAELDFRSGTLSSKSENGTVYATLGKLLIGGGEIKNTVGFAIISRTSLYLYGNPNLSGLEFDIQCEHPISLSNGERRFTGSARIYMKKNFAKGEISTVFYKCTEESLAGIKLYDENYALCDVSYFESSKYSSERNFGAVYLPYSVKFYDGLALLHEDFYLSGEGVLNFGAPEKLGYEFKSWSYDLYSDEPFEFDSGLSGDLKLYASYSLLPPRFSVSSYYSSYDEAAHYLGFDELEHPLLNEGMLSFSWYKGDSVVSSAKSLKVETVSDSGEYYCKILFTHNGNSVAVTTPMIEVLIEKMEITVPEIGDAYYTGEPIYPELSETPYYTVNSSGAVNVGKYPVTLTLKDSVNTAFVGTDEVSISLEFNIKKAQNSWSFAPIISSAYEGEALTPRASAKFGTLSFLYSDSPNGVYSSTEPSESGSYYMKAYVAGSENYYPLESEAIAFSIIPEIAVGMSLKKAPDKTDYTAFELAALEGVVLLVTYNSGRVEEIYEDKVSVKYQNGTSFRYGDRELILSYGEARLSIPVNVRRADYDISNVVFEDIVCTFDGNFKTIDFKGSLPVGIDGYPLLAAVKGTWRDVGVYEIVLEFRTESPNYHTPASISASLEILPIDVDVIWENLEFVYNGKRQAPSAYYLDINGEKHSLEVTGGATYAGNYTASIAKCPKNYNLIGETMSFTVEKADYDVTGVKWSTSEFVYDGSEKRVYLVGLPQGVSVAGYSDNFACDAGEYTAKFTLLYDSLNYNEPKIPENAWKINKASYSLDGFSFENTISVYDGACHYPTLTGTMPTGADGISLEYSFDKGATSVNEGRVMVLVEFKTESKNYKAPEAISAYVEILPLGINVVWEKLSFVYSGNANLPSAYSEKTKISVTGSAVEAGSYTARAISENSNYYVINDTEGFTVQEAENSWTSPISVTDIFEDGTLSIGAESVGGTVLFSYFSDSSLSYEIEKPLTPGVYYAVAYTDGGRNYTSLTSDAVSFEIKKCIPISLYASILTDKAVAFQTLGFDDFDIIVEYNSGRRESVDKSLVSIRYERADSLRADDCEVSFSAFGLECKSNISVARANYDMSGVMWSFGEFVYDGEKKEIYLTSLPEGVEVVEYSGNGVSECGKYKVVASLSYDSVNFNPPNVSEGELVISKCPLKAPLIKPEIFTGEFISPQIENAELYNISKNLYRDASLYSVRVELKDHNNFYFEENGDSVIYVDFQILPLEVEIYIHSVTIYLLDDWQAPDYTVSTPIPEGEDLMLNFSFEDGKSICTTENKNYKLRLVGGNVSYIHELSPKDSRIILISVLLFMLILLFVCIIFKRRDYFRRAAAVSIAKDRALKSDFSKEDDIHTPIFIPGIQDEIVETGIEYCEESIEEIENVNLDEIEENNILNEKADVLDTHYTSQISPERANELISDSIAKTLIHSSEGIEVFGAKRRIINVDTLSASFSAGERVDINIMKSKKLIPYDTGYIKVLARGMLDKPLSIYANDFSLSAVKMIALMGGEAVKIKSIRVNFPKNPDE